MNTNVISISAATRTLKTSYILELQQDLVMMTGGGHFTLDWMEKNDLMCEYKKFRNNWPFKDTDVLSYDEEMMLMLEQELQKEFDKEILKKIKGLVNGKTDLCQK